MLQHNKKMQDVLKKYGIECTPKYLFNGSLKKCWRLYNKKSQWTDQLIESLSLLGFKDFSGDVLTKFSGNGGKFSVFVKASPEMTNLIFTM